MSLIPTCERNGVNPFDYLTARQKHVDELYAPPADWMPWNYRDTLLKQTASSRNSGSQPRAPTATITNPKIFQACRKDTNRSGLAAQKLPASR
jgi:hypothetical protein